ncbi:pyridoxamine 5'-phosphate oxidase family protein [Peptoniphilus equinus]|uniref:Pyridoxamine 5'-phosphate oxidase family protein n=1 Tax=Peptoniphilus equinus TaxID=3016343 RepID=A0ABY7QUH4_9FIRM|nr:pyridoxamine 5'-phosphate oxidase family protein [Peptoniphilus equinus]WBW50432.1 pyridoxamine 5'-phosphate oxidase family protein [Peptoniphilus equinus]
MKTLDLNLEQTYSVIDRADFAVMSVFDFNIHSVPFSHVRDGAYLYFASRDEGTKVDIFEREAMIKLVFVVNADVAHPTPKAVQAHNDDPAFLKEHVFSNTYESAIADGRLELVHEDSERLFAIEKLYTKYYPDYMAHFETIADGLLDHTNIYKVLLSNVTGKKRG